jgi:tellurite resistance protein TerC
MLDQLWPLAGGFFMGHPVLVWCGFLVLVAGLLVFDLRVLHRHDHTIGFMESLRITGFYVAISLAFGGVLWATMGAEAGMLFVTAFLVEKTLSLDNVFVISTIFAAFAVPSRYQHRGLFWGIIGVGVMRGAMILLGGAMIARFHWVLFLFGGFLVLTGIKMLFSKHEAVEDPGQSRVVALAKRFIPLTHDYHGHAFFVRETSAAGKARLVATPLLPALLVVEAADLLFALDSIPAVLAISTDAFVVFSSNIFAVLGLRALYSVLSVMVGRFVYLRYALSGVLMFIGAKIFWVELVGPIPAFVSLAVTVAVLGGSIALSLLRPPTADSAKAS